MQYGECHAHIMMDGRNYKDAVSRHRNGVDKDNVHRQLQLYKDAGISFIRDGGDALGVSAYAKTAASDYGIDYRTPIFAIHKNGFYGKIVGRGFDTLEEYKRLIDTVSREKGDFIKVMASGILDFDQFGKVSSTFNDPDLLFQMAELAHAEGFSVMVHVNTARQAAAAIEAGCDSIEHGYYMDEHCFDLLVKMNAVWVPTLATCTNLSGCGRFSEENVLKITASHCENIRLALRKGVHIASGSDAGAYMVPHAEGLFDELRYLNACCSGDDWLKSRLSQTLSDSLRQIQDKFKRL